MAQVLTAPAFRSPINLVKQSALAALRASTKELLRNEEQAWQEISIAIETASESAEEDDRKRLKDWVYAVGLVYITHTGLRPAFSNCENQTRFGRFIEALPKPLGLRMISNSIKKIVRDLDFKKIYALKKI